MESLAIGVFWESQTIVSAVAAMVMFRIIELTFFAEKMRVWHHASVHPLVEKWKNRSKTLKQGFKPALIWSIGSKFFVGSVHTLVHNVVREFIPLFDIEYEREIFRLECGGTIALDWAVKSSKHNKTFPSKNDKTKPIVFIHHGLTGCSRSHYVQSAIHQLAEKDVRVVCMVARGCGGLELTTPYGFSAAGFDDLRQAAEHVRRQNPGVKLFGIGYSLGAGLLANYLGRSGENSVFSGAFVASPCWDFQKTTDYFRIWSKHFLAASLQSYSMTHKDRLAKHSSCDFDKAMAASCVHEFDKYATVPVWGFENNDEYYRNASPVYFAKNIVTPTLALSADDDPVCSVAGAETIIGKESFGKGLCVLRSHRGGHVSWAEGWFAHNSFMDRVIMEWFEVCTEEEDEGEE